MRADGDYTQWRKNASPAAVASAALSAIGNLTGGASRRAGGPRQPRRQLVFLATNCREGGSLAAVESLLNRGGASLVRFAPAYDDPPRHAFVEQLIASHATTFLYSAASFYSQVCALPSH